MFNIRTVTTSLLSLWHKTDSNTKYINITSGYSSPGANPHLLPNLTKLLTSGTQLEFTTLLHKSAVMPMFLQTLHSLKGYRVEKVCSGPLIFAAKKRINMTLKQLWVLTQDLEISKITSNGIFFTFLKMATDQVSLGGERSLLICCFFSCVLGSPWQLFQPPTMT